MRTKEQQDADSWRADLAEQAAGKTKKQLNLHQQIPRRPNEWLLAHSAASLYDSRLEYFFKMT